MRIILEVVLAAALVAAAWETPWRERGGTVIPGVAKAPAHAHRRAVIDAERVSRNETTAGKHSADWMWKPTVLDQQKTTPSSTTHSSEDH
jgi:hypothetical protein